MNDDILKEVNSITKEQDSSVEADKSESPEAAVSRDDADDVESMSGVDQADQDFCNEFALELSRSLEYFQLQSGQKKPTKFLFDPAFQSNSALLDCLSQKLPIPSEVFDITKLSELKTKIDPGNQMLCLSVIGAGLNINNLPTDSEKTEKKNETAS